LCDHKENPEKGYFARKQSAQVVFAGSFACKLCTECQNKVDEWLVETPEWEKYISEAKDCDILRNSLTGRTDIVGEETLKQCMENLDRRWKTIRNILKEYFSANAPVTPVAKT
jgi:hypothetical protein